jgi:hypothetical protein
MSDADGSTDPGHPAAASLDQLTKSQNAIRDTTKWLVAAAAGVGAVVVAGLQLSHLPTGTLPTILALVGFGLSLMGAAFVLFSAAKVLSGGFTTLGQLADLANKAYDQEDLEEDWNSRILMSKRRGTFKSRAKGFWLEIQKPFKVRYDKIFGDDIWVLVKYLNTDARILSNGLANSISDLYDALKDSYAQVLALREQPSAGQIVGSRRA